MTPEVLLTDSERAALVSAAYHAFGTHAVAKHEGEFEERIVGAVECILAARLTDDTDDA